MFQRLQNKWKVNTLQLILILCTFAIGGSITGYAGRRLMNLFAIDQRVIWIIIYIILITIIWPLAVLLVSIPFGQFRFFIKYLQKVGRRMGIVRNREPRAGSQELNVKKTGSELTTPASRLTTQIAIFASGTGSNAQKIIDHFKNLTPGSSLPKSSGSSTKEGGVKIALIVCNNPNAGVLSIAAKEKIPSLLIEKERFFRGDAYLPELKKHQVGFIVLAGFLWKIPVKLINEYPRNIINIHPALLPKHGGKGMYGDKVHEAVLAAGEKESGITIHYVDEHYDNGDIILQVKCEVLTGDDPSSLAQRIHALEYQHYPSLIERLIKERK